MNNTEILISLSKTELQNINGGEVLEHTIWTKML